MTVVYEDNHIIIVNKTASEIVQGDKTGDTPLSETVKQSESAKKPLNTVFQDICKHEVLGDFFTDKSFNLENPQKVS